MKRWRFIATGILTIGTLAGAAWAAEPTKADMDFCNQKAAQVSKPSPVQPGTNVQAATQPPTGGLSDSRTPGTPVSPGSAQPRPGPGTPQPGNNPTGGRITDSSQPGTPPSARGMASVGETDPAYRHAYLVCINERAK
jgi:hypothetical protein